MGWSLSQDLETGCPKLAIVNFLGVQIFKGGAQYTQISNINMYAFIEIRHDILIQCHRNYMETKKVNYMVEIDILRNSSQKSWVSWGVLLKGLGVQKEPRHPADYKIMDLKVTSHLQSSFIYTHIVLKYEDMDLTTYRDRYPSRMNHFNCWCVWVESNPSLKTKFLIFICPYNATIYI